jgi:hypothetical protein
MTKIKCRKSLLKSSHVEKCISKIENHDFWGNIVVVVNGLTYLSNEREMIKNLILEIISKRFHKIFQ